MDVVKPPSGYSVKSVLWVGILFALLTFISTLLLWMQLKKTEFNNLQLQMADAMTITVNPIQNSFQNYIEMISRMARRWEYENGLKKGFWINDADNLYRDTEIFYLLARANANMKVEWVAPQALEPSFHDVDLAKEEIAHDALLYAKNSEETSISKILNLPDGKKGLMIIDPLYSKAGFDGYLIGLVDIAKLFKQLFLNGIGEGLGIAIYQEGIPVYATRNEIADPMLVQEKIVNVKNIKWKFYLWPDKSFIKKLISPLPTIILISGSVISLLILVAFYFYNKYRINTLKMLRALSAADEAGKHSQIILNSVNEGFISINQESTITEWNPYAEKLFGWQKKEVLGKKIYEVIIPEMFRDAHQEGLKRFLKTGEQHVFNKPIELTALHKDKKTFPIELIIFPLHLNDNYSFHSFIRDISERKRAEEESALLASIIDTSEDAIVSTDLKGFVLTWNKGAEKMYGYRANEVLGRPINVIYPVEGKDELKTILDKIKKGEHVQDHDAHRISKSGQDIPVSVLVTAIKNKDGKIIGGSSITRDITERKHIEKMKNEFISIVSHELRTPLTSIRGSIGILASGKICELSDKAKQLLDIANQNCERLIRLINDILDIEKIEAGKMAFNIKMHNLNRLIKDAIDASTGLAAKHNVKIEFKTEENYEVNVDADRIMQVLINLLSNAIRYSPLNGIVKIQLTNMMSKVRVSVIDNGPGIPKEFQEKIFGKFRQADSSDTRKKGGTGLGLNISQAIIERHNSKIGFMTTEGRGSTFYFDLPLTNQTKDKPILVEQPKRKVLICDANATSAEYLKAVMLKKNIDVDIANSADSARNYIKQNNYSAITFDITLPGAEGLAFIRELRDDPHTQYVPLVVLAVHAQTRANELNGIGFPLIDWMEKPITEDQTKKLLDYINARFSSKMPKILSVEDDNDVTRIISMMVQNRASVWNVNTIAKAKKILQEHEFDLVILDIYLPDGSGTDLLPCINARTKATIPVIVFSIDELSKKYSHMVKTTLLKSIATNEQLFQAIESAINTNKETET